MRGHPIGPGATPTRGMAAEMAAARLEAERPRLVAYARRLLGDAHEAEDVAQEALVRALASGGADARSLGAWLTVVCYRLAVDRVRARRIDASGRAAAAGRGAGAARADATPAADAEATEEALRLRAALEALAEPYRSAVRLRFVEGLAFADVATRLGTIERTARTWVGRGLFRLREAWRS